MAFKVSNETKVGALTAIAITLLILGVNFLKGKNPLKNNHYVYAKFVSIEGLVPANPVVMNGLVVGSVYKTEPADVYMNEILVTIRISENIKIPVDSRANIKGNLLSTPVVEIVKGGASTYIVEGDTLITEESSGFLGAVLEQLGPTQKSLNVALQQIDTFLVGANNVLNAKGQEDLRQTLHHLNTVTGNLAQSTALLNNMLRQQNNAINSTIANLENTSKQLNEGTKNLPAITQNVEKATQKFSELDVAKTLKSLDATIAEAQGMLAKLGSSDGSLGALMNDKKLYNNLTSTVNSLNLLMQDLRLHPKRYINVSVFGRKDKSDPLMRPLDEDSITQEQIRHE